MQPVLCGKNFTNYRGCQGGYFDTVWEYASKNGLDTANSYPLDDICRNNQNIQNCFDQTQLKQQCDYTKFSKKIEVQKYSITAQYDEKAITDQLVFQTLVAEVFRTKHFELYDKGIFDYIQESQIKHPVTLVGYGQVVNPLNSSILNCIFQDNKGFLQAQYQKFFIIKNNWGTEWGEGGYMRLKREDQTWSEGYAGIGINGAWKVETQQKSNFLF